MATSLVDVNDLFLSMVDDYRLNALYEQDVSAFNVYLEAFLIFAIDEFSDLCTQALTYSTTTQEFTVTLTNAHKIILARIMKKYWLQKEVHNILQMNNFVQDRDFKTHSSANALKEKQNLCRGAEEDISQMLQDYAYKNNTWTAWENQDFN